MVLSPGSDKEAVYVEGPARLKEGEMLGRNISDINRCVNGDGKLSIKFIIFLINYF